MSDKKKSAVVCDKYKVKAFRKAFREAGFKWEESAGIVKGTRTLTVFYDEEDLPALYEIVKQTNEQVRRDK